MSFGSSSTDSEWEDVLTLATLANESVRIFCASNNFHSFDGLSERSQRCSFIAAKKRIKIETDCPAPSTLGNLSLDNNKIMNKFFIHRPNHGLHVSLLVETFGKFQDMLKREEIPEPKYVDAAIKVMLASALETTEAKKCSEYLPILATVFDDYETPQSIPWGTTAQSKSDISIRNKKGDVLVNFEIKKELCGGGSEPVMENLGYYIHFQRNKEGQHAPMFLVVMAGPYYMQVFGAAWDYDKVCMDPLSDPLSLLYVPCDTSSSTVKLARVFNALSTLANELTQTQSHKRGPYFSHGSLEICQCHGIYTRVFDVTWNARPAIMKFTSSSYGITVHTYLFQHQLAPKVLHSARLPGNWFVVIMEKVGAPLSDKLTEDIKESLQTVLTLLKKKAYVHGDLRRPNIRVKDNTVRVLDFDWAGKEGEARYPSDLNNACTEWHSGVKRGELIKSEHDNHLISLLV